MDAIAAATEVKRLTHRETRLIVLGMLLPIFMGSLDQTILASALPTIGRDLRDAHDLPACGLPRGKNLRARVADRVFRGAGPAAADGASAP
jgi:hypothetical protein